MVVYPYSGTTSCPDLLLGLGFIIAPDYVHALGSFYPYALFFVRHCNGTYSLIQAIIDPSIEPAPPLLAIRSIAVSQFSGDPPGTLYAGGFEVDSNIASLPDHNTDWVYRGVPSKK